MERQNVVNVVKSIKEKSKKRNPIIQLKCLKGDTPSEGTEICIGKFRRIDSRFMCLTKGKKFKKSTGFCDIRIPIKRIVAGSLIWLSEDDMQDTIDKMEDIIDGIRKEANAGHRKVMEIIRRTNEA